MRTQHNRLKLRGTAAGKPCKRRGGAILAASSACGGIGRRARLRALWTLWSVEVRVLSGALRKPCIAGLSFCPALPRRSPQRYRQARRNGGVARTAPPTDSAGAPRTDAMIRSWVSQRGAAPGVGRAGGGERPRRAQAAAQMREILFERALICRYELDPCGARARARSGGRSDSAAGRWMCGAGV